jgi:hypothetical protein
MSDSKPARTAALRTRSAILAALVVVIAAIGAALGYQSLAVWSSSATSPTAAESRAHRPHDSLHGDRHGALGEADGVVPDGVTVFDDEIPAMANLDPALLGALRQAATDAAGDGVEFFVDSGWRSRSTAQKRKLPVGWPPRTRLLTCRGTRSTSGTPMPRRGCPNTAPTTGCARPTATNPGTTNCAPKPSLTVARPCTPTLRTIPGCSSDQHARYRTGVDTFTTRGRQHE